MGSFLSQETGRDMFSGLPVELLGYIISLLLPSDVANLRLMSKYFALLGRQGLFNDRLTLRIYRDDMLRLRGISECPWLAACIQEIEIFVADTDLYRFHEYNREVPEDILAELKNAWTSACMNGSGVFCHEILFATAFSSFTNVKSVVMTSTKFPFEYLARGDCLRPTWRYMVERDRDRDYSRRELNNFLYDRRTARFPSFVLSARAYLPPLTKLIFDPFPIEALVQTDLVSMKEGMKTTVLKEMIMLCRPLGHLHITFDGSYCGKHHDGPSIGRMIADFLGSLQHVRILELAFPLGRFTAPGYIEKIFGVSLPCLQIFRLERIRAPPDILLSFLLRHKATIKELRLSSTALLFSKPSELKDFMTLLRDSLRLEKFEMFDWDPKEEMLWVEERCQDPGEMSRGLEKYAKSEGPWPHGAGLSLAGARSL
ncbi:hypothetical protein DL95DRAFT_385848 [Leptodontidium sp. 2 PMI_412]|nr:hypothetical protein DL95DRAFT_385848 [Leptodontidium sp. 2 PMI_412]